MDAVLDKVETQKETVIFDCYSNEYADELRSEMNKNGLWINAKIESDQPRKVIGEREI